jgi:NADH-quinone oxidoreductase subunit H
MTRAQGLDQIFVTLTHALTAHLPVALQPLASALLGVVGIIVTFPALFAITVLLERKGLGRMQNRYGPNRVGPWGILQPVADGIKAIIKEDVVPQSSDHMVHLLAPVLILVTAFMNYAVIPVGRGMILADLNAGVLFFFAISSMVELGVFMAGWASRSKYSLFGAMRAIAQMISYEVPMLLAAMATVMAAGTLSTVKIVEMQAVYTGQIPHWFVLTPWGFTGFCLFMVAATAESNRSPFDLPEGESEIVAGYFIEYSGFKFAMFFIGEYLGMMATSAMAITLFLGGWSAPLKCLQWFPSYGWFFLKLLVLICCFIWVRGTLPRLRMDQLMNFSWKFLLPMTLLNIAATGLWRFLPEGVVRWVICGALVVVPYVALGRARVWQGRAVAARRYRYAE